MEAGKFQQFQTYECWSTRLTSLQLYNSDGSSLKSQDSGKICVWTIFPQSHSTREVLVYFHNMWSSAHESSSICRDISKHRCMRTISNKCRQRDSSMSTLDPGVYRGIPSRRLLQFHFHQTLVRLQSESPDEIRIGRIGLGIELVEMLDCTVQLCEFHHFGFSDGIRVQHGCDLRSGRVTLGVAMIQHHWQTTTRAAD